MSCQGICHRYKTKKSNVLLRYAVGQRWCSTCTNYFNQTENICKCCKSKLRAGPRRRKNKETLKKYLQSASN